MSDTLIINGDTYIGVTGIKTTDSNSQVQTYIRPQGTLSINANATSIDVSNYALVDVNVSGGDDPVWTRPSDWPNLDALDINGGDVIYLSYLANEANGFCDFTCKTSAGLYTVEIGTVSGSTFTADSTYNINSNSACRHYFGSA